MPREAAECRCEIFPVLPLIHFASAAKHAKPLNGGDISGERELPCPDGKTVICAGQRCDGPRDCPGGEDEDDCGGDGGGGRPPAATEACPPNEFACDNRDSWIPCVVQPATAMSV